MNLAVADIGVATEAHRVGTRSGAILNEHGIEAGFFQVFGCTTDAKLIGEPVRDQTGQLPLHQARPATSSCRRTQASSWHPPSFTAAG